MTVPMNLVAITNLDVKVCNQESNWPQWNLPCSLTQPKITRQRHFKLTDIELDLIKDEISIMECVEYTTYIRINVMHVDDIEDSENL